MRVWSRIALVVIALFPASALLADHFEANCPLSLADSTPPDTSFDLSPHGVFRSGSLVYALRGQVLTTYTTNDVGNLQIAREDFIASMAARETDGGVAFADGYLYVSSEAGLEIFDLRNVRVGGTAPVRVSRTAGYHYRRMAINGTRLAGLYPSTDLPCYPTGSSFCTNQIELVNISSLTNPVRVGAISSYPNIEYRGWNDVAFNSGYLIAVGEESVQAFDVSNLAAPHQMYSSDRGGRWLVSNGSDFLAVGTDSAVDIYSIQPGVFPFFGRTALLAIPSYLTIGRSNPIRFSRTAYYDEANGHFVTLVEEVNPQTLEAARTVAFDVFDFSVPRYEGSVERIYEDVTLVNEDEVKYNPVSAGNYVYVIGEETGIQSWGSCGIATGRIELDSTAWLTCGGAEIHGWVTGVQKIVNVELFLNNTVLGAANLTGPLRNDVSSTTPVLPWRVNVNLDATVRGEYQLRAIATDVLGNRRQFAMKRVFFNGPGQNCTTPRRRSVR
jgi:hypothetical protein